MTQSVFISNALSEKEKMMVQSLIMENFPNLRTAFTDADDVFLHIVPKLQVFTTNSPKKLTISPLCFKQIIEENVDLFSPELSRINRLVNLFFLGKTFSLRPDSENDAKSLIPQIEMMGGEIVDYPNSDFIVALRPNPSNGKEISPSYIHYLANSDRYMTFADFFDPPKTKLAQNSPSSSQTKQSAAVRRIKMDKSQKTLNMSQSTQAQKTKKPKVKPDNQSYTIEAIFSQALSQKQKEENNESTLKEEFEKLVNSQETTTEDKNDNSQDQNDDDLLIKSKFISSTQKQPVSKGKFSQKSNDSSQKSRGSQKSSDLSQRSILSYSMFSPSQSPSQSSLASNGISYPSQADSLFGQPKPDKASLSLRAIMTEMISPKSNSKSTKQQTLSQRRKKRDDKNIPKKGGMVQKKLDFGGSLSIPISNNDLVDMPTPQAPNSSLTFKPNKLLDDIPIFSPSKIAEKPSKHKLKDIYEDLSKIGSPTRNEEPASRKSDFDNVTVFSQVQTNGESDTEEPNDFDLNYDESEIKRSQTFTGDADIEREMRLLSLFGK